MGGEIKNGGRTGGAFASNKNNPETQYSLAFKNCQSLFLPSPDSNLRQSSDKLFPSLRLADGKWATKKQHFPLSHLGLTWTPAPASSAHHRLSFGRWLRCPPYGIAAYKEAGKSWVRFQEHSPEANDSRTAINFCSHSRSLSWPAARAATL